MIGASKILTVSYGTFSCTLEGFDEPFSTMKAIAEYFRDLAADDRYFGAEPPTPDAEMLSRIAEREIQRRVEAKINERGVVLRQTEGTAPGADPMAAIAAAAPAATAAPASAVSEVPAQPEESTRPAETQAEPEIAGIEAEPETAEIVAEAALDMPAEFSAVPVEVAPVEATPVIDGSAETVVEMPVEAPAEAAAVEAAAVEAAQPTETAPAVAQAADLYDISLDEIMAEALETPVEAEAPEEVAAVALEQSDHQPEPEPDSIAAKLLRIRAVVENVRHSAPQAFDEPEDLVEAPQTMAVSDDFGFDIDLSDDAPDLRAAELARAEARAEEAHEQAHEPSMTNAEALSEPEIAKPAAEDLAVEDLAVEDTAGAMIEDAADKTEAAEPMAEAAMAAPEDIVAKAEPAQDDDALILANLSNLGLLDEGQEAKAAAPEPQAAAATADLDEDNRFDDDDFGDDTDLAAEEHQSFFQRARAGVIRLSRVAILRGHDEPAAEIAQEPAAEPAFEPEAFAADEPAAPVAETASAGRTDTADEDQADVDHDAQSGRALLEHAHEDDDGDIARLMDEAKAKLEGAENRRRFSAISHLKAAVAATLADRKMHTSETPAEAAAAADEEISLYRDDLSKAVRPRRPVGDTSASTPRPSLDMRPAPLVLVSEQRIDRPDASPRDGGAIRPRRVSSGNLAVFAEDADDEDFDEDLTPEAASSFAEFAERLGATTLTELLEAAAAYTASVEGQTHFSRPQIMRKVEFVSSRSGDFSREDGMRSFGMLLRQGKIQKISRGQFTIADTSKFMTEARNAG